MGESGVILEGERVRLRPAGRDDLAAYIRWFTDADFRRYMGTGVDVFEGIVSPRWDQAVLSAETTEGRLIGFVMIGRIRNIIRNCELTDVGIGEKDSWDQGYGTEMVKLALGYCFRELGMHQVRIVTDVYNERAQRCYGRIFPHRAVHRDRVWEWQEGRFWDQIYFDILEDEFAGLEKNAT